MTAKREVELTNFKLMHEVETCRNIFSTSASKKVHEDNGSDFLVLSCSVMIQVLDLEFYQGESQLDKQ
mgnify:CR=1 FL=1